MRRATYAAAFIVLTATTLHAQVVTGVAGGVSSLQEPAPGQPGTPQRMPARPVRPGEAPPKGSAIIRGVVTASGTGAPVRRAQVRAMSMEARGGGSILDQLGSIFGSSQAPARGRGRSRESVIETAAKSAARAIGSEVGRQVLRGVLGSILGGGKRR